MKKKKLQEINSLLFEFIPLYHQKFAVGFLSDDGIEPKCTKNQLRILFITKREERILPTDLGKCLDMPKGSLTTLIDSLEESDLIQRLRDPYDRRKTWISLTAQGQEYVSLKIQALDNHFEKLFGEVSIEDVEEFTDSLKFMVGIMKKL